MEEHHASNVKICRSESCLAYHVVVAQLEERLNGIEEVSGSNPLGSTKFQAAGNGGLFRSGATSMNRARYLQQARASFISERDGSGGGPP